MNKETDSLVSWEALCRRIVSPVLIIHVKPLPGLRSYLPGSKLPPQPPGLPACICIPWRQQGLGTDASLATTLGTWRLRSGPGLPLQGRRALRPVGGGLGTIRAPLTCQGFRDAAVHAFEVSYRQPQPQDRGEGGWQGRGGWQPHLLP